MEIAFLLPAQAISTYVDMTYPSSYFLWTDEDLPARPGTDISQYKKELIRWGNEAGISVTQAVADAAVNLPSPIIFKTEDGSETKILDSSYPLWNTMRDILFLESTQESIQKWQDVYINSGSAFVPTDAFDRARQIYKEYNNYVKDTSATNCPLQNLIFSTTEDTNYTGDFLKEFIITSSKQLPDNIKLMNGTPENEEDVTFIDATIPSHRIIMAAEESRHKCGVPVEVGSFV